MPRTAILYIAERCNQACVFCLEEDGTWNEFVDPSTQQIFDTLARLRRQGAEHITFMGGETFFRKDLPRILHEARAHGYTRIGVTTNGTVLSKKGFLSDLVNAGLDFIELSIHGHTPELANTIGGTHFTFERQADALTEINALGILTIVNVVICRENASHLGDVIRYVREKAPNLSPRFKLKFTSLTGLAFQQAQSGQIVRHEDLDLEALGDELEAQGALFWYYNLPLCRLGHHAAHSHELSVFACDERYFDYEHRGDAEYYESGFQIEGRVWPESTCSRCTLRALCPGIEETYRAACGSASLMPQQGDPLPLLRAAMQSRGLSPELAPERLEILRREPRPARFVRQRPEGALRFTHPHAPEPLDLTIELKQEGKASFFQTERFSMGYRSWPDQDAQRHPLVLPLLRAAALALRDADRKGMPLKDAQSAVAEACPQGWQVDKLPSSPQTPKKRVPLPLLSPDGRLL